MLMHHEGSGEQRAYYIDENNDIRSIPLSWTDVQPTDPFLVMAGGRSPLRTPELIELVKRIEELSDVSERNVV
jgi:hypothetical protein